MEWITNPEAWVALATLTALEIVLGIDNVVFISILSAKLPVEQQEKARRVGRCRSTAETMKTHWPVPSARTRSSAVQVSRRGSCGQATRWVW